MHWKPLPGFASRMPGQVTPCDETTVPERGKGPALRAGVEQQGERGVQGGLVEPFLEDDVA